MIKGKNKAMRTCSVWKDCFLSPDEDICFAFKCALLLHISVRKIKPHVHRWCIRKKVAVAALASNEKETQREIFKKKMNTYIRNGIARFAKKGKHVTVV